MARMPVRNRTQDGSLDADVAGIGLLERDRNLTKSVRVGRLVGNHVQMSHCIEILSVIGEADLNRRWGENIVQLVNQNA